MAKELKPSLEVVSVYLILHGLGKAKIETTLYDFYHRFIKERVTMTDRWFTRIMKHLIEQGIVVEGVGRFAMGRMAKTYMVDSKKMFTFIEDIDFIGEIWTFIDEVSYIVRGEFPSQKTEEWKRKHNWKQYKNIK